MIVLKMIVIKMIVIKNRIKGVFWVNTIMVECDRLIIIKYEFIQHRSIVLYKKQNYAINMKGR